MKRVRLEFKNNEYRLVVFGTNQIVFRNADKNLCLENLKNQREYAYMPTFEKGQHYAV